MSTFATGKPIDKKMQGKILLAIGFGALLTSFDSSSVVSILPVITHSLHSTINESKWVVTLYLLTISSLLLASGRLGDLFGHRRLYISGLQICLVGALLCALAPSIEILACFRIIEGIGAVLILANGAALLIKHCEFRRRGRMLGYLSSMAYIGLSSGPPLSGWLSDVLGWRSVFVAVFLIAGSGLAFSVNAIPQDGLSNTNGGFDFYGTLLLAFALAALVLVFHLSRNSGEHPFSIPCLIGVGVIAIVIAVRRCSVQDLEMLYNRPLLIASIAAILNYAAIYNVTFVLPFYLLDGRKLDPVEIGFILTVRPVITALVAPFSGAIADRYGVGNVSKVGLFIILIGFFLFFEINGQSQTIWIILSLVSVGLGMGLFIAPNHSLIMNVAPFSGKGVASAILSLNRNLGMLIGASLGGAFFLTIRNHQSFDTSSINVSAHIVFSISTFIAGIALILLLITDAFNFLKSNNVIAK